MISKPQKSDPATSWAGELAASFAGPGGSVPLPLERLLDDLSGLVFFIKDREGRYLWVNRTLVDRCGLFEKAPLIGKRPSDLFPETLAPFYERQDERVIRLGKPLIDQLELHFYPGRRRGWCLTSKYPIFAPGAVQASGVLGVSRDVETSSRGAKNRGFPELSKALQLIQQRIAEPPSLAELAEASGLSPSQFAQWTERLFHLTPKQLVMKARIDEALHLLATSDEPLSDIALATGFCDQSAFTRHFHRFTGMPPGAFRQQVRGR
ncbi:AraC family transcriptional regulator [Luteolibacter sp. LG18]|uniref:AraC family transcriptional regulator n=1 Tax=Luteolibacter sp. LG18 TaxID=2819286 RepID=UPI002B2EEB90|nr:transcriptional regulator [Luteolibacter sp. LG18]